MSVVLLFMALINYTLFTLFMYFFFCCFCAPRPLKSGHFTNQDTSLIRTLPSDPRVPPTSNFPPPPPSLPLSLPPPSLPPSLFPSPPPLPPFLPPSTFSLPHPSHCSQRTLASIRHKSRHFLLPPTSNFPIRPLCPWLLCDVRSR